MPSVYSIPLCTTICSTFRGLAQKKHPHRRNVTRHHFFDYYKFHQYTTFINRQLSSIDNFHQRTNLVCVNKQLSSSLTRATSVKALEAIFKSSVKSPKVILTHQSHISQISRRHLHTPGSHQSNLLKISSLTRVISFRSIKGLLSNQSHISQVCRRHLHSLESH